MPWEKGKRVSTNLITGFLGSGKTTSIKRLLDQRSEDECWSILVNEFGTVSIDHALVDPNQKDVAVAELGGGCACCTMSFAFKPLLAKLIRNSKPDRLIIEPSGLSHPAKVVDILRGEDFSRVIDLRNIICLVDPDDFKNPQWKESEVFNDQIQLADIVLLNWSDKRDRKTVNRCREWIESFSPPKQLVIETKFGEFRRELLDLKFDSAKFALFPEAHSVRDKTSANENDISQLLDSTFGKQDENDKNFGFITGDNQLHPNRPLRFQSSGSDVNACGWVFHPEAIFDHNKIINCIKAMESVARVKGVFQGRDDWWAINRAKEETFIAKTTYRRESRLEIILNSKSKNWDKFEAEIMDCRIA